MSTHPQPWSFDWTGIPEEYIAAAMDSDGSWCCYEEKPTHPGKVAWLPLVDYLSVDRPPYPGDWKDSLQIRP